MPSLRYCPLTGPEWPLLNKFYKSQRSSMRAVTDGQLWVARGDEIVAGLCLSPVADGHWLTGLWVATPWRGQQIARHLLEAAVQSVQGTVWLFCHPDLLDFYNRLGFDACANLPPALGERLARYQRSKPLLAMARNQSSLAGSRPGNSTSV